MGLPGTVFAKDPLKRPGLQQTNIKQKVLRAHNVLLSYRRPEARLDPVTVKDGLIRIQSLVPEYARVQVSAARDLIGKHLQLLIQYHRQKTLHRVLCSQIMD